MTSAQPRYPIPARIHRVEEEIKRSRFITTVAYTPTVAAARDFISEVSSEQSAANHNCWAYVVGPPGTTGQVGMSDDGEPHGTAGRPMLTVLLHSGIGDICAVVTRYFGGTLLGKGGLVKAYSGGVQLALRDLPTTERVPKSQLEVVTEYNVITPFKRMLTDFEVELLSEEYTADATFRLQLPSEHLANFIEAVTSLTNGLALIDLIEEEKDEED
ncbi:MAG: YigZ family protein [Caldilineaceae bacterium]|nr:YigZ family protein [Caldilineaceae bacterium]